MRPVRGRKGEGDSADMWARRGRESRRTRAKWVGAGGDWAAVRQAGRARASERWRLGRAVGEEKEVGPLLGWGGSGLRERRELGWLRRCALGRTGRSRGGLGQRRRGRAGPKWARGKGEGDPGRAGPGLGCCWVGFWL